jgi:putative zinc finger/helix-turn-helix YgiT family protein
MNHNCRNEKREFRATHEKPFHFVDSGLSSVYLIGIRYFECSCGRITADIPAIKQLMQVIARNIVEKPTSLTGEEIRFLRKRLGKKQADLAHEIGVEAETLSRYENGHQPISESNDKLLRFYYVLESEDEVLFPEVKEALRELLSEWSVSSESKEIVAAIKDNEWELAAAA